MASYYYLIASLPELRSDGEMPCTYDEFLTMCEGNISGRKMAYLKDLSLDGAKGPLMKEWRSFYNNLTGELNTQRSALLGKSFTRDYDKDPENTQIVQSSMNAANPLEAEKLLLKHQFEKIDDLIGLHTFDDVYLFGYAIKLKLLERRSCFKKETGKKVFRQLFETVQQKVYSL